MNWLKITLRNLIKVYKKKKNITKPYFVCYVYVNNITVNFINVYTETKYPLICIYILYIIQTLKLYFQ